MTNEYDTNFSNDLNFCMDSQTTKVFELIQNTLIDNHDDEFFNNKKIHLCSQNQDSTPPTSPFQYASYESSCDTSFSSCSSSSLSPILTPTTSIPSSHSTLNSIPPLSTSPLEDITHIDESKFYNDLSLIKMEQDLSSSSSSIPIQKQNYSYENEIFYEHNTVNENLLNIKTTQIHNINNNNQQNQYYYSKEQYQQLNQRINKEQLRISSLIENQQQQYLKCKEFNDEQCKIDPEFLNSNLNLFKWTFIKPKFPLLFDQMYDKANGCFFLAGIPVEFIFELYKYNNQDLLTEDCLFDY
ncbi:hypothetical protein C1645_806114 [Glomus cerebriforme]|uniref:Uncharacterized protein n=1 Tax=Glomus cerebriforme TaxID=658196 RepID=A0A397SXF4_9GLOM|nr:hypothetical protein C1645_806114 [Glomus cerebriforme]